MLLLLSCSSSGCSKMVRSSSSIHLQSRGGIHLSQLLIFYYLATEPLFNSSISASASNSFQFGMLSSPRPLSLRAMTRPNRLVSLSTLFHTLPCASSPSTICLGFIFGPLFLCSSRTPAYLPHDLAMSRAALVFRAYWAQALGAKDHPSSLDIASKPVSAAATLYLRVLATDW